MEKIYPIVEGKYRFLGGWYDIPKQLQALVVGKGYEITHSDKDDYIIRGSGSLIMIDGHQLIHYFEPYVDYNAEPLTICTKTKDSGDSDELIDTTTSDQKDNFLLGASDDTEIEDTEQLSLF
ncbi:hypothetical protein MOC17_20695 [Bacillus haynesii]|uniref:hypothetical protein n=1 Tax=Bacillus haynesii TaxID=1925021 RepID=UPI00227DFBB9|nr:hypothetical protein [Bacillus haynesii]MCY8048475.1 hypothetical protein [Bacillus haynesii]